MAKRPRLTPEEMETLFQRTETLEPEQEQEKPERKSKLRPSETKRKSRKVTVTFSDEDIPARIRDLALEWGRTAPDKKKPGVSEVIEHLLMPRLEEAEKGLVDPP